MRRLESMAAVVLLVAGAAGMAWRLELAEGQPARATADLPLFVCPLHGAPAASAFDPVRPLAPRQPSSSPPPRISSTMRLTSSLSGRSSVTGSTLAARRASAASARGGPGAPRR